MPQRYDLVQIGLLDGPSEDSFDQLMELGACRFDAPVALISIIDEVQSRQWFKSSKGLSEPWRSLRATPLSHSFCRLVAADDSPLVVVDARQDDRVSGNPAIHDLGVVAYLGVPIRGPDGEAVGALCVIDGVPRAWSPNDVEYLRAVASAVDGQIRLKFAVRDAEVAQERAESTAAALHEANVRFQDLARNLPGAVFRYSERADGTSQVEYMSPGCLDIWEISPEEVAADATPLWSAILPEDLSDMQASVRRSSERLARWQHRWRIRTPSGKLKWLDGYGHPARGPNGDILWNSLILDVTVEVAAQQHLAENTTILLEASKQEAIGRLAGGIAHDFNNLLSIVLGNAESVLAAPEDTSETVALVDEIRSAALRGAELTRRILGFARRSDLRFAAVDVNRIVTSMHNLLHRALPSNIVLETSLMAGLWKVRTDASFLESAVLNLVVNARDAMSRGGRLTIETANARITEDYVEDRREDLRPGRYVMVAVTDTGEGIDAAVIDRIFEPFFTTKSPDKGTGLGLAMVFGFAKQSGGTIRVYSEVGRGTSFRVYLPVAEEDAEPVADPPRIALSVGTATLLLVEDQAAVRKTLKLALESRGFSVLEAESGDAGLRLFEQRGSEIDLIVTDVVMPGRLQGPELVAAIRATGRTIPVVYVSGYPHEANVHGNGIAANDVSLTKPVDRETLYLAVTRALARTR